MLVPHQASVDFSFNVYLYLFLAEIPAGGMDWAGNFYFNLKKKNTSCSRS